MTWGRGTKCASQSYEHAYTCRNVHPHCAYTHTHSHTKWKKSRYYDFKYWLALVRIVHDGWNRLVQSYEPGMFLLPCVSPDLSPKNHRSPSVHRLLSWYAHCHKDTDWSSSARPCPDWDDWQQARCGGEWLPFQPQCGVWELGPATWCSQEEVGPQGTPVFQRWYLLYDTLD